MGVARDVEADPSPLRELVVEPGRMAGVVELSGAKNSALRCLVASLLTDEPVVLANYPASIYDAEVQVAMLGALGKSVDVVGDECSIGERSEPPCDLEWDGRSIRNTLLVLGALLARRGEGSVPLPGGCDIGQRPFDLHEGLFRSLGAEVWVEGDRLHAKAPGGLGPGVFHSSIRSTGVTENALLCGAQVADPDGVVLVNPHLTPEVLDLAGMLRSMGAVVEVDGSRALRVRGPASLRGTTWRVVPDRIEAVTWAAAAVTSGGDVEIADFPVQDTAVALEYLTASGARVFRGERSVIVRSDRPRPFQLAAGAHPAVHSDMQPLFAAIAAVAAGRSEIVDLRYPDRFRYLDEFRKLGVDASYGRGMATIHGGSVGGGAVTALDLRGGASLVLLALGATDEVRIDEAWQVLRGYDRFVDKARGLGTRMQAVFAGP